MALSQSRFTSVGETPYAHEQEGIQLVRECLPNNDPYHAWALFEIADPRTGRLLEIDMLVIGYSAIYLVELKAHPGRISGDATDWYFQHRDAPERKRWMKPPFGLANMKARILKSRLREHIRDDRDIPYIQALVFLTSEDLINDLRADGRHGVVTRSEIRDALMKHRFPGAHTGWRAQRISAPQIKAVATALDKLGIRARKGKLLAGEFELQGIIDEGPGYQDREAVHRSSKKLQARARTYLVPEQTSVERRQQLRRAADREAALLYEVRDHPGTLSWLNYVPDAPLGPTVLLDAFPGGIPLPAFLRTHQVTFWHRISILEQVAHALDYCHKRTVVHGGLSPEAVLVRREGDKVETRLTNFQLGSGEDVEATSHWSALASSPWALYQAPELREGSPADARSDVYSLGSLAYYLFTERHPAEDLVELYEKLSRDHALDARIVDSNIPDAVAEAIELATQTRLVSRADDAQAWILLLLDALTQPVLEPVAEIDPLEANKEDILGDLLVMQVLGQGATSRVLQVLREKDARELALKVSLNPDNDDRLRAEAEVLEKLRSPRIVEYHETRTIAGRTCLLIGLAGSLTLKRYLDEEGTVSLDFANRYGRDLLDALIHLEELGITHRDIKPANLGVGTIGKKGYHLTLFDFSLAHVTSTEVGVGTSAYRDPFLPKRGAWDAAADRYSAAVTFHEMLTGVRPSYGSALDPDAELSLAAERFDASVRSALVRFFEQALHRDVERRFATAEEMRRAWDQAFEAPKPRDADSTPPPGDEELTDDVIRGISADTPIMALPLSFRARNALDRAGLLKAGDLRSLPENRLSVVRGVGSKVAQEILDFRMRWAALSGLDTTTEDTTPFHPDYSGDDILVTSAGLDERTASTLYDAGLRTLGTLAKAPKEHVKALAERAGQKLSTLKQLLARESAQAHERDLPQSVDALLHELLYPKRMKRASYVRALYGLEEPFLGRLDVGAREVATHFGKTRANIYLAVAALREVWEQHGALGMLEDRAAVILDAAGGAMPMERAAAALLARLPHESDPTLERARAAALLRVVAEVQKTEADGIRAARIGGGMWLLASQEHTQVLRRLGQIADALAQRDPLASPGEAQRKLQAVVRGTPLETAPPAQVAEWAAAASEHAACSALMEIYPRGMAADRALELSAAMLTSAARRRTGEGLTPTEAQSKVAARYTDAAPLPARPELDALLTKLRLEWNEQGGCYLIQGEQHATLGTSYASRTHVDPSHHRRRVAAGVDVTVAEFERSLKIARERKRFRVIGVNPAYAFEATRALEHALGIPAQPLDALLIAALKAELANMKQLEWAHVQEADAQGPRGARWKKMVSLFERAEQRVVADLRDRAGPFFFTQPGLLERYGLDGFLAELVNRAATDDAADAAYLLVPCHNYGGVPQINDRHPIPGVLEVDVLWVPRTFVFPDESQAA